MVRVSSPHVVGMTVDMWALFLASRMRSRQGCSSKQLVKDAGLIRRLSGVATSPDYGSTLASIAMSRALIADEARDATGVMLYCDA